LEKAGDGSHFARPQHGWPWRQDACCRGSKSELVGQTVLERPAMVTTVARVVTVQPMPAREMARLVMAPVGRPDLPGADSAQPCR
jgi:hypothetical protein